jgi:hypothetical protein
VVAGLVRQVGEQVAEPPAAHPQPVMLRPRAQQHLGDRQAHKLGVGQLPGTARPPLARFDDVIVDRHVQCRQEGIEVCSHERPLMPSSHFMINPTRRNGSGWESSI